MASGTKITSGLAGAGKSAVKALQGYPGIFHHLAGEHAEVAALMKRVAGTTDSETREELFPEIRRNLLAHAKGEEAEFYPPLRSFPDLEANVARALDEHQEIEQMLESLNVGDKSTGDWSKRFEQMMAAVEKHVDHEENDLFPKANDLIESKQAKEMESRFEEVEKREKARL
jgi:hemerythrin superfamily protein